MIWSMIIILFLLLAIFSMVFKEWWIIILFLLFSIILWLGLFIKTYLYSGIPKLIIITNVCLTLAIVFITNCIYGLADDIVDKVLKETVKIIMQPDLPRNEIPTGILLFVMGVTVLVILIVMIISLNVVTDGEKLSKIEKMEEKKARFLLCCIASVSIFFMVISLVI